MSDLLAPKKLTKFDHFQMLFPMLTFWKDEPRVTEEVPQNVQARAIARADERRKERGYRRLAQSIAGGFKNGKN